MPEVQEQDKRGETDQHRERLEGAILGADDLTLKRVSTERSEKWLSRTKDALGRQLCAKLEENAPVMEEHFR